jgi:hypothetical protein
MIRPDNRTFLRHSEKKKGAGSSKKTRPRYLYHFLYHKEPGRKLQIIFSHPGRFIPAQPLRILHLSR